jgi:hypothetical protein
MVAQGMRKSIFYILFLALILSSCKPPISYELYPLSTDTFDEAWAKCSRLEQLDSITYGYWQSPKETESLGGGCCKDLAVYLMYHIGESASVVVIKSDAIYHMIVKYDGKYFDVPCKGFESIAYYVDSIDGTLIQNGATWAIVSEYNYQDAMRLSTDNFTK